MEDKKSTGTPSPQRNLNKQKTAVMLITILALILILIVIIIVLIVKLDNKNDDPDTTTKTTDVSTPANDTGSGTPNTQAIPESGVTGGTLTEVPQNADATGKVTVSSATTGTGSLILVNSANAYKFDTANMFEGTSSTTADALKQSGFAIVSPAVNYTVFLRTEANTALKKMITDFNTISKTTDIFVATSAYSKKSLTSDHATGLSVDLKIQGADKLSYSFDYSARKVTVNETSMTYEAWFKTNCAKYGFVYEGLSTESVKTGQFRYVGTIHAPAIAAGNYTLETYLAAVKAGTVKTVTASDATTWKISYVAAGTAANTVITVGANATYVISGDNLGGFVVAVKN